MSSLVVAFVAVAMATFGHATASASTQTNPSAQAFMAAETAPSSTISAGLSHTCAVQVDHTAKCWGFNDSGQLGDGTTIDRPVPVTVIAAAESTDPLSGVTAIAAGYAHTCALIADGTVRCWGWNGYGLGDDTPATRERRPTPVVVKASAGSTDSLSGVIAIAAGEYHTCAVLADGTARCWGENRNGELGDGTTTAYVAPVTVVDAVGSTGPLTRIRGITVGNNHSCAVLADGTVWCWGANGQGQLGNDDTTRRPAPVAVKAAAGSTSLLSGVDSIAAGSAHTCAQLHDGTVVCWGENGDGQLGDGSTTDHLAPVAVVTAVGGTDSLSGVIAISAGYHHTCAVLDGGTASCWGHNSGSSLGDGTRLGQTVPVTVLAQEGDSSALLDVTSVSVGQHHTCAVLATGVAKCWGFNDSGQLGDDTFTLRPGPVTVLGLMTAHGVPAAVSFRESVPSPAEITLDPVTVAQSVVIATGVVILVPFPGILFNSTLEAHHVEIGARLRAARNRVGGLLARLLSWARRVIGRPKAAAATNLSSPEQGSATGDELWRSTRGIALFVLATALLGSFLDPTFGFDLQSLATLVGLTAGLIVVLLASNIPRAIAYSRSGVAYFARALPVTLAVGVVCVLISRLTDFQPGYLYGLIVGLAAARTLGKVGEGRTAMLATVVMLVVAAAAWFGMLLLPGLTPVGAEPSLAVIALQTALATTVVAGVEACLFGLIPMRFLPGEKIRAWNPRVWRGLLGVAVVGFLVILINPSEGYLADTSRTPMLTIVALLALFGLSSVLFWAYFRFRRPAIAASGV